jgi:hypothetical protein
VAWQRIPVDQWFQQVNHRISPDNEDDAYIEMLGFWTVSDDYFGMIISG